MLTVPQDVVGPLGNQHVLLTHIELNRESEAYIPLCRTVLQVFVPSPACTSRIAPSQVQDLEFDLLKFMWLVMLSALISQGLSLWPLYPQGNQQLLLI